MSGMVEERLLTRKVCVTVVAAAACALVCASAAARPDVSSVGTVLSPRQYYGPGGPVYANEVRKNEKRSLHLVETLLHTLVLNMIRAHVHVRVHMPPDSFFEIAV